MHRQLPAPRLLAVIAALMLPCTLSAGETSKSTSPWPQFRGPLGNGIAEGTDAPTTFSEEKNIAWKTEIPGKGWSSAIAADGLLWMTTAIEIMAEGEERIALLKKSGAEPRQMKQRQIAKSIELKLLAVDQKTGKHVETIDLFTIEEPDAIHSLNSYASPTPVFHDGAIYCHFGTFGTVKLNAESKSIEWTRRIPVVHGVGPGSSPYVHNGLLVLICDGIERQYVTALNINNGETVWTTDRPPMNAPDGDRKKAYCTPVVTTDSNGREQLICMGSQWLVSYVPETGQELWRCYHGSGFSVVPRPVIKDDVCFISTGFGKPELWAIRIDGRGDVSKTHVEWVVKKSIPAKPSPLLVGKELFIISDQGVATCLDAATGDVHWQKRVSGNYSASPLLVKDHIYFGSHEGKVTVVRASADYEEIAENSLDGQIMASPIAFDDSLFIRTDKAIYRIAD